MLRHLVLADCAQLCADPVLRDTLLAMAYGLYPPCVGENPEGTHLSFRRSHGPADDRDRQRRVTEAVESLNALPAVRAYHAGLANPGDELHVEPPHQIVAWPIAADRTHHLALIPALLTWTQWDHDRPWEALRAQVAGSALAAAAAPYSSQPRHLKQAQVLDFVGRRAAAEGRDPVAECARANSQFLLARLEVTAGEDGVGVRDVTGY